MSTLWKLSKKEMIKPNLFKRMRIIMKNTYVIEKKKKNQLFKNFFLSKKEKQQLLKQGRQYTNKFNDKMKNCIKKNKKISHINYKIFYLLYDPFTFVNAFLKINENRKVLTRNYEKNETIQFFLLKTAKRIAEQIKKDQYQFKPVKKTWIAKLKKWINISIQSDQIVQEVMREVLKILYKPVFNKWEERTKNLSNHYGFRLQQSAWSTIKILRIYSKTCTRIIEGDIVSAYSNVDHNILLNILKQYIRDIKFLNFIKRMLKTLVINNKKFEHNSNGSLQGSILSPQLFNIYMLGFDQYIYEEFIDPILKKKNKKFNSVRWKIYAQFGTKTATALGELQRIKKKEFKDRFIIKIAKKNFKKVRAIKNKTLYSDVGRFKKGAVYVRYTDDWVLALTCNKIETKQIKKKILKFLMIHKKMQLNNEKTKITHITKGYRFLGFEIQLNIIRTSSKLVRLLQKGSNGIYSIPLRRISLGLITIEPDSKKILKKMKLYKFCNKKYEPRGKAAWTIYDEFQIVTKYAQVFREIFNYYELCKRLSKLSRISYLLQYSCAKTLAKRVKTSLKSIFEKYTIKMVIEKRIQGIRSKLIKKVEFAGLTSLTLNI